MLKDLRREVCVGTYLMVATTVELRLETQDGCSGKAKIPFAWELKIYGAELEMHAEHGLKTVAY